MSTNDLAGPVLLRRPADVSGIEAARLRDLTVNVDDRDIAGHLGLALRLGEDAPMPGRGGTAHLWEILATLGCHGLQRARVVEPHLDAIAILDEAGTAARAGATWGVFAAEGGTGRLRAERVQDSWLVSGVKPWCSLGDRLARALVTAWVDDEHRGLFDVDLSSPGVSATDEVWVSRGLCDISSTALSFGRVPARPVGAPGWYLRRDGFAFGGIGVAAVWYGASVALLRRLVAPTSRARDQIALMHIGQADQSLVAARATLLEAAHGVDGGQAGGAAGALLAARVRGVVARSTETLLSLCAHALGPRPLVQDPQFAALVADLGVYVRQHHGERDDLALGRLLVEDQVAAQPAVSEPRR